jgi:hypothetical protein
MRVCEVSVCLKDEKAEVMVKKRACRSATRTILSLFFGFLFVMDAEAATAPSWIRDMPSGVWQAVSLNTLADVDPAKDPAVNPNYPGAAPWRGMSGQTSVVTAWNGGAFATRVGPKGSFLVWGGGHTDYYGNEIYAFDLEQRRWTRVTDPYKGPIGFPYQDGMYPDGSPVPPHNYDQIEYHEGTNSLIVFRTMISNLPTNAPVAAAYSFDAGAWRHSTPNSLDHHSSGGWSAYDAARNVFWAEGGEGSTALTRFDPSATSGGRFGSWTNFSPKVRTTDAVAARDPVRDLLVIQEFRESGKIYGVDAKNPSAAAVVLSQGGAVPAKQAGAGWEWSDVRQAFLYWGGSGAVVSEFKLSGSDWRTGVWSWSSLTSPSNSLVPQNVSGAKTYSRFRLVRFDDAEIAILVTDVSGPVYAFRIPGDSALRKVPNPPTGFVAH